MNFKLGTSISDPEVCHAAAFSPLNLIPLDGDMEIAWRYGKMPDTETNALV